MKLRLRSLESKETLRIEVPDTSSLQHLQDLLISRLIPNLSSSPSSSSSSSVHLSLNRKDELLASSPQDSLHSLGITSGDLIFFTLNPTGFSPEPVIVQSRSPQQPNSIRSQNQEQTLTLESDSQNEQTPIMETPKETAKSETLGLDSVKEEEHLEPESGGSQVNVEQDQTVVMSGTENMDVDDDDNESMVVEVGKSFSVPGFLRKVFRKELGDDGGGRDHKLLVIAVHAVLIESGFVGFDSVSNTIVDGFYLPDEWPSSAFTMSLSYTLPAILTEGRSDVNGVDTVVLKFQTLGKFLNINGRLAKNGSGLYRVCLDEGRLVPFLNVVWGNCDSGDAVSGMVWNSGTSSSEKEVFKFWKIVKDRLALPLLIDLCEQAGLAPPPCFMRLPTDLKSKILESLPGVDLAKVGCVCSELLYLSSNEDLWKQKFSEQFGYVARSQRVVHWKEKFASFWESRKRRNISRTIVRGVPNTNLPYFMHVRRDPNPLGVPGIIGGDHDRLPALGVPFPFGQAGLAFPHPPPPFRGRRNFLHRCNLGGRT